MSMSRASGARVARYHDEVWGKRTADESALFEAFTLGVFEVGLSWRVALGTRDSFRQAFHQFDISKVAVMSDARVEGLSAGPVNDPQPSRSQGTVANAREHEVPNPNLVRPAAASCTSPGCRPRSTTATSQLSEPGYVASRLNSSPPSPVGHGPIRATRAGDTRLDPASAGIGERRRSLAVPNHAIAR